MVNLEHTKTYEMDAHPTNLVSLTKKVYGIEKRFKVYCVNVIIA